MSRFVFILLITAFSLFFNEKMQAQNRNFSDATRISMLVSSPGNELYSAFGHSAIRVTDSIRGLDWVFNYGVFDFDTPNFYSKFVRGKLLYKLAIQEYQSYWASYDGSQQLVTEQVFQLDTLQKREFLAFLMENYKPENRLYLYDFFYDNCATRIRDIIEVIGEKEVIIPEEENNPPTFRDLLHDYVGKRYWTSYGIDIILGLEADKKAGLREQMFLPEYLSENLAQYRFPSSQNASVFGNTVVLKEKGAEPPLLSWFLRPGFVMGMICLIILLGSIFLQKRGKQLVLDRFLFILLGLGGLFITFMWFGTDHIATQRNLNLLWLNPLYFVFAFYLSKPKNKVYSILRWILLIGNLAILINLLWWPQYVHPAFLPIIGLVVYRLVRS